RADIVVMAVDGIVMQRHEARIEARSIPSSRSHAESRLIDHMEKKRLCSARGRKSPGRQQRREIPGDGPLWRGEPDRGKFSIEGRLASGSACAEIYALVLQVPPGAGETFAKFVRREKIVGSDAQAQNLPLQIEF
ncbi:hypothetical protein C9409_12350, partial [Xanthomonas vasicola pv. vasculorum]